MSTCTMMHIIKFQFPFFLFPILSLAQPTTSYPAIEIFIFILKLILKIKILFFKKPLPFAMVSQSCGSKWSQPSTFCLQVAVQLGHIFNTLNSMEEFVQSQGTYHQGQMLEVACQWQYNGEEARYLWLKSKSLFSRSGPIAAMGPWGERGGRGEQKEVVSQFI